MQFKIAKQEIIAKLYQQVQVNNANIEARIKFIREKAGLTQQLFGDSLGVSRSVISQIEGGQIKPSIDLIATISSKYKVDYTFLIDGTNTYSKKNSDSIASEPIVEYAKEQKKGIPLISIEAMAGLSNGDITALELESEHYYIPEFQKKADFLIRIAGTSMSPKYYNGDVIACKRIPKETFIQWGKVYVMDTVQGALCKRLFESKKGDAFIKIVSDNDAQYPAFDMPKKEIRSLAIVIGVIRLE